jgi:hypothetical protein
MPITSTQRMAPGLNAGGFLLQLISCDRSARAGAKSCEMFVLVPALPVPNSLKGVGERVVCEQHHIRNGWTMGGTAVLFSPYQQQGW